MKIVHIEDVFHPDTGYQLNILSKYMVAAGHDVTIICAETKKLPNDFMSFFGFENIEVRDEEFKRKYGVKIIRIPTKGYYSGRVFLSHKLYQVLKSENPDVLYIHGNDTMTAMNYLLCRKKYNYPLVLDSHMLEMAAKNRFKKIFRKVYRLVFTPIIVKNSIPVIRTQDSDFVEKAYGIPLSQAPWISTGSDTMLFKPDDNMKNEKRSEYGISADTFVVTYAGKLDEAKGGMLLADMLHEKIECSRKICFVIIGNTTGSYGELVEHRFSDSNNQVFRFPTQKYEDLASFFQMSDIVVFPKQCSLSFYDAQACGVPVVFEDNEINKKRAAYNNAITFKCDDINSFRNAIIKLANMPDVEFNKMRTASVTMVKNSYDYKNICDTYLSVLNNEINKTRESM